MRTMSISFPALEKALEMTNHKEDRHKKFQCMTGHTIALDLWQCIMVVTCGRRNCHPITLM